MLGVIFIYSAYQIGFDKEALLDEMFWIDVLFKYILQFFWIYFGIPDGKIIGSKNSDYIRSWALLQRTNACLSDNGLLTPFEKYIDTDYIKGRQKYIDDILYKNGIEKTLYNNTYADLRKNYKTYELSWWQYRLLVKLKRGRFQYDYIGAETYTSVYDARDTNGNNKYNENHKAFKLLFPKLVMVLITLVLSSGLIDNGFKDSGAMIKDTVFNFALSISSYGFAVITGLAIQKDYTSVYLTRANFIRKFVESHDNGKYLDQFKLYKEADDDINDK